MTDKKQQFIELKNGDGTIKVEINRFFEEALKQLKKNAPEKLKSLREQIDEIIKAESDKRNENAPKIGERFNDSFGRTWMTIGKNVLSEEPTVTLRRGNTQVTVRLKDCYEKNGAKKIIEEKNLVENLVEVQF